MDNAAQHFAGRTSSGLYEDRDEDATRGGCYCKPLNLSGSYEEPRSRVLYNALAALGGRGEQASRLRLLSYWNLTVSQWSMHVARTRPERSSNKSVVCDCTHYCYSPEFWRGAFFPALRRALPSVKAGAKRRE